MDFRRDKVGIPAKVETIEYDPNRSANISLLCYADGERRYILAPEGLAIGRTVVASPDADILVGNALPLKAIPLGTTIHNVELRRFKGGQMVRSAGAGAQLVAREGDYAQVRLPSGEVRKVHVECYATIGQIGNLDHENESIGKAGRNRWKGWRPHVRGVAMSRRSSPRRRRRQDLRAHPVTPWGFPTGQEDPNTHHADVFIVRRRVGRGHGALRSRGSVRGRAPPQEDRGAHQSSTKVVRPGPAVHGHRRWSATRWPSTTAEVHPGT